MQQTIPALPQLSLRTRFTRHPLTRIVAGIACVLLPLVLTMALVQNLVAREWRPAWPYLLCAFLCLAGYSFFVRRFEQRAATESALRGAAPGLLQGLGIGAAVSVVVAGVLGATGAFSITGSGSILAAFKPLPEQVMVAVMEELLFRAVLFRITEERWGTRTALLVNMLLFALAHLPNEHVTALAVLNTGVAGLGFCAAWMLTRSLWLPVGLHFAWNYLFDGVFGVPVSGHAARGWLQVQMAGPEWLSGGAYGVEASVVTLLAWSALTLWALRRASWRA